MSGLEAIKDIYRYSNLRSIGATMHSHHYHDSRFEIYYMVEGVCSYFVNDKTYEVLPGDIVLIPEGIIHKTNYNGEEHQRMLIECKSSFIPEEMREALLEIGYLYRNVKASAEVYAILRQIEEEYKSPDAYTLDALRAHTRLLLTVLLRNPNAASNEILKNVMIESVVAHIKKNYQTDITLSNVARDNFVSAEHLSRSFKRYTGFGFNEFLTLVRLRHAQTLLKSDTKMSISEIAYTCGFNDSNYFSDKFKRTYGRSPLKYSKESKKKRKG